MNLCPTCRQKIDREPTRHNLSVKHVRALYKLKLAVEHYGRAVHIKNEMFSAHGSPFQLTLEEHNNFTKLRFHDLAYKQEGKSGYWGVTSRGYQFLRGDIGIPKYVLTLDNKIMGHEGEEIRIQQVDNGAWWERPLAYSQQRML